MILILGCGYTGQRAGALLAASGHAVVGTRHRRPVAPVAFETVQLEVEDPASVESLAARLSPGLRVLHSIPLIAGDPPRPPSPLVAPILAKASRVVYLSTTGVYGSQHRVDETTLPEPAVARERLRVVEEQEVARLCRNTLILRPAAIYGPGRGVHVSLLEGRHKLWGDGSNWISRIHVDDLAAIAAAAVLSDLTGAYPVADDEPCPAIEITRFCAGLLGVAAPEPSGVLPPGDTRSANRRVDGTAIRRLLGVSLRYPGYRTGIPASL